MLHSKASVFLNFLQIFWQCRFSCNFCNSVYHEEQAVEVSRKSVNFLFFVVKRLKNLFSFSVPGNLHFGWLQHLLWAVLWPPHQHQWCRPGTGSKCCLGPGPEDPAATRLWSFLRQPVHQLPPPRQALGDGHCWNRYCPAESPGQGAHRHQEGGADEDSGAGLPGDPLHGRPDPGLLERQPASLCCHQQVLCGEVGHSWPVLQDPEEEDSGKIWIKNIQVFLKQYKFTE